MVAGLRTFSRLGVVATVALAVVILLALAGPALAFPDVPAGHPYEQAINDLSTAGIIGGYANGNFGLTDPVKRAQFAKMIAGALDLEVPVSTATRFTDLGSPDANGYPHRYVQAAYDNGITTGTNATQTLFDPWKSIRRDQVITMIVRGANGLYPGGLDEPPAGTVSQFDGVPEPHGQNLRIAEYNGLLDGLIGMGPGWSVTATATRGEVAKVLWNLLDLLGGSSPSGGDVWVYTDGSGDYPTIEAAVADVGPGTTINLGPGTFTLAGTLTIDFDCNLVGSGMTGNNATTVRCNGEVIDIDSATFSAKDIRFVSTATSVASDAMYALDADVTLQSCFFSGANRVNEKRGNGLGLFGSTTADISDCVFTQNDLNGLEAGDETEFTFDDNDCSNNGQDGILLWGTASGTATGNTCNNNTYQGILVTENADGTLEQNTCSNNGSNGIGFWDDTTGSVSYNTCSTNAYAGIACYDNTEVTVEHNTCQYNGENGILLTDTCAATVRYNTCSYSQQYDGIALFDDATAVVQNNVCLHNYAAGIYFGDTSTGNAGGNECAFNYYGIAIGPDAHPTIGSNNLHDNITNLSYDTE